MAILQVRPLSKLAKAALGILAWILVLGLWYVAAEQEWVNPIALPHPQDVVKSFISLWTEYDLLGNVLMSWWRIAQAFFWSAVLAIPLGILMASYEPVFQFLNPVAAPMRSMPVSAFLPALMGLLGMGEGMKVGFLFIGMFFYLLAVVVEEANRVRRELIETALTLGANHRQILWLVFRASLPPIYSSFRILYDIGWTYVILAEVVNSRRGVGYMIEAARKFLEFDRVYAGIIAIGLAAFAFRWLLRSSEKLLFPWQRVVRLAEATAAPVKSKKGAAE